MRSKLFPKFLFLFCFVCSSVLQAYPIDSIQKTLSVSEFIEVVKKYHPVAKQAQLIPEQAKAELLIAQGGWDPAIYSSYDSKTYDGGNYYSYFENKISVPVWYGIEVNAGYDFVYGGNINSENKLPKDGLGYLGISVPLLKNMLMDKQRAALRKAQIFREASEQQRIIILNDLLLDALKAYYNWSYAYNEYQIYKEATDVAVVRFNATVQANLFGDRAAIDTTEALTQLQNRQFQLNDARLLFLNSGLELSNYLWLENEQPRAFDTAIIPAPLSSQFTQQELLLSKLDELTFQLQQTHPVLLNYNFKLRQLDIERKLKIENLKPTLNAKYNVLSERFNFQSNTGIVFSNNYKFGINFAMPLTFMQGRGALRLTKIEIQNTRYAIDYKQQELANKLRSYFNELINLQQQTKLYEETVSGYKTLFDGETIRFNNGESSLFLVNARENRFLDSQVKLRELQAKYYKTEAALKWSVGNIGRD
jgi:outer membrane protein TolC